MDDIVTPCLLVSSAATCLLSSEAWAFVAFTHLEPVPSTSPLCHYFTRFFHGSTCGFDKTSREDPSLPSTSTSDSSKFTSQSSFSDENGIKYTRFLILLRYSSKINYDFYLVHVTFFINHAVLYCIKNLVIIKESAFMKGIFIYYN